MNSRDTDNAAYRVLIVDDNKSIHADMGNILIGEGGGPTDLLGDEELLFQKVQLRGARFEIGSAYQGEDGLAMVGRAVAEGIPGTILSERLSHSDSLVILKKPFDNIELIQLAHALTKKWTVSCEAQAKRQDLERMVQQATAELTYQANHDALTGLPNRRLFADRLEQAIALARRHGEKIGLLYIDLDGFKLVNDTSGHALGDLLLCEVVKRMKDRLRQCDTLARMGGHEFTLIATGLTEPEAARVLAQRLREVLQTPFQVDGDELFATASGGDQHLPATRARRNRVAPKRRCGTLQGQAAGKEPRRLFQRRDSPGS